ncbi:hypothetical protein M5K25_002693 [Dendrobium thyrsiflorum]|uniref:DUF4283 domain-containing protein n=1 Tax=Dendrobium thyrsiflorum TaxID=117978 RepID=A0ABD0VNC0_DENTH
MAAIRSRDTGFLDGKLKSRSFKDALAGESPSSAFPLLKVSSHHGLPALLISGEELLSLAAPFEFALVEKFPGRRPPLDLIRKFFFNLKLCGAFSVIVLNPKNVLIKLVNDLNYCRVFFHRSYFISNCFMKLFKWTSHFDVNVESPIVPIWVSFPYSRPHLFSPRILHGLGSLFCRPLRIDNTTTNGTRPSVADILIELDVTKRYTSEVWIGFESMGYIQTIEMEEFSSYCFHCKTLGHSKDVCPILFSKLGVVPPCREEVFVDVSVNPDIVYGEVPQDDLGEHHDVNGAFENAVVVSQAVSPRLNEVGCISLLAFKFGNVVFQRDGGFVSPTVVSKEVACVNLIESEAVGVDAMVLSHGDEVVVAEMVGVLGQPACPDLPGVEVAPKSLDGAVSHLVGTAIGVSVSPVVVVSLYPENLIEVPIGLMSDNDLNACVASNVGATCITSSAWCGGCPSPPCGMDDDIGNEQLDSLQDVYGIDVYFFSSCLAWIAWDVLDGCFLDLAVRWDVVLVVALGGLYYFRLSA